MVVCELLVVKRLVIVLLFFFLLCVKQIDVEDHFDATKKNNTKREGHLSLVNRDSHTSSREDFLKKTVTYFPFVT